MSRTVSIQELAIVVVARNHNPTILNPDFLKYNDIVPKEWELEGPPLCVEPVSQVKFKNGISIIAQLNKLIFVEPTDASSPDQAGAPRIARKYLETLPHVDYRAIGINIRGHVKLDGEETIRKYLAETLVSPGPWREFGKAPLRAEIKFKYTLEKCECNLTVEEAPFEASGAKAIPVVAFSANFHHEVGGNTKEERLSNLYQIIETWQNDLNTYRELINEKFILKEANG
jgi:hypothetical protein